MKLYITLNYCYTSILITMNILKISWNYFIANVGLLLSGSSLFLMWIFSNSSPIIIMFFALLNSIWYAACMWLSQASFLDSYNKSYADYKNLEEIDANASAAPIKI